ncbi:MAG: hypothetical protein CM1200mP24_05200 [Gammaproteobacteria bacterium]|nr:MAG: hypothetical protein CM1200mP24_05200 [Gammaproteobacteria bacterium]
MNILSTDQKSGPRVRIKRIGFFCLVRTDPTAPKHEGISFILFDMTTPGVDVKPILLISGYSPFCQPFFLPTFGRKGKMSLAG